MKHEKFITGNAELNEYIEYLEKELDSYGSSNTKRLMRSIDQMAGKISNDIDNAITGSEDGKEVKLSEDLIDNFMKMIDKSPKFKSFIDISEAVFNPKKVVSEEVTTTTSVIEETTTLETPNVDANHFEKTLQKIKERKNATS